MFNPLHPFEWRFLELFKARGVKAFVKQTYQRGNRDGREGCVLVHFEKLFAARQYFDVQRNDPNRELFDLENTDDVRRLQQLISTQPAYTMLTVKDADLKARKLLDKKLRAFIEYKLGWQPGRNDDVVFSLDVQFGEVYARLKFRSKEISVKLAEIEQGNYVL